MCEFIKIKAEISKDLYDDLMNGRCNFYNIEWEIEE